MKLTFQILKNRGDDSDYPPEKFPFVLFLYNPQNKLASAQWGYFKTEAAALAFKDTLFGRKNAESMEVTP